MILYASCCVVREGFFIADEEWLLGELKRDTHIW